MFLIIGVKFDSCPKVISSASSPSPSSCNSVSRIKHAKKEKKGILGGFYFYHTARKVLLSHCKTGARVMHLKNQ